MRKRMADLWRRGEEEEEEEEKDVLISTRYGLPDPEIAKTTPHL